MKRVLSIAALTLTALLGNAQAHPMPSDVKQRGVISQQCWDESERLAGVAVNQKMVQISKPNPNFNQLEAESLAWVEANMTPDCAIQYKDDRQVEKAALEKMAYDGLTGPMRTCLERTLFDEIFKPRLHNDIALDDLLRTPFAMCGVRNTEHDLARRYALALVQR